MRFIGINGINTHGESNTDVVLSELSARGYDTVDVRLPKRHTITASFGAKPDALRYIVPILEKDDILVAHSFGCLRAAHAIREYGYIKAAFLIAPAMSHRWEFPDPSKVFAFCSTDDWIVSLGSKIPGHPFGYAGTAGFNQLAPIGHNYHWQSDHDDYFSEPLLSKLTDKIVSLSA